METLNYDVISIIFDFLHTKDCFYVSILNKNIFDIIKNNGFMKILQFNKKFPFNRFQDGFDIMKQIIMHKRRVQQIEIYNFSNPIPWIPQWSKTMIFNRCNLTHINPSHKVITEHIYIENNSFDNVIINYDKFPKLKEVITFSF